MSDVKWIKIVTDIFDDEKMLLIESLPSADSIIVIWFKLLCLAGKQNNGGVLMINDRIAFNERMLATIFRREESVINLALKTFEDFGMVEIINDVITIPNWSKHQSLDKIESKKAYDREYQRKRREKAKLLLECKENNRTSIVDMSNDNRSLDKNKNKNKKENKNIFIPPTIDEIKTYIAEKELNVDADTFFKYFSEGDWHDSQGKAVKNWKQKLITWDKHSTSSPTKEKKTYGLDEMDVEEIPIDELRERMFRKK